MNQPTEDRIRKIEEEIEKLKEQQTEPIQVTVERKYPDKELLQRLSRGQDEHARLLLSHSRGISMLQDSINRLTTEVDGMRADIISFKATQSDHGELLQELKVTQQELKATQDEQSKRFDKLEEFLMQILNRLPKTQGQ